MLAFIISFTQNIHVLSNTGTISRLGKAHKNEFLLTLKLKYFEFGVESSSSVKLKKTQLE